MPGTPLHYNITPGKAKRLNAFSFNRMMDAADAHSTAGAISEPSVIQPWQCTAWVYNSSARLFGRGECGKIISSYYDPATQLNALWSDMVLEVGTPDSEPYTCIAYEDVAPGSCGRAYVTGVCPAIVDVSNTGHEFAKSKNGTWELESATTGPYRIVWKGLGAVKQTCIVAHVGEPSDTETQTNRYRSYEENHTGNITVSTWTDIDWSHSPDIGNQTDAEFGIELQDDGVRGSAFEKLGAQEYFVFWNVYGNLDSNQGTQPQLSDSSICIQFADDGVLHHQDYSCLAIFKVAGSGDRQHAWALSGHSVIESDEVGDFTLQVYHTVDTAYWDVLVTFGRISFLKMSH